MAEKALSNNFTEVQSAVTAGLELSTLRTTSNSGKFLRISSAGSVIADEVPSAENTNF